MFVRRRVTASIMLPLVWHFPNQSRTGINKMLVFFRFHCDLGPNDKGEGS
jgi:hypothetical protein